MKRSRCAQTAYSILLTATFDSQLPDLHQKVQHHRRHNGSNSENQSTNLRSLHHKSNPGPITVQLESNATQSLRPASKEDLGKVCR